MTTAETTAFALRKRLVLPTADEVAAMSPDDLYPAPAAVRFTEEEFIEAGDLEALADLLIEKWPELGFIEGVRVRYLWKAKQTSTAQGKCTKASGFWRRLAGVDFVIWLAADTARNQFYTREQVEALLYHEMRHIGWDDEKGAPITIDHDTEVFFDEFRRYGVWSARDARFGQLALDGAFSRGQGLVGPRFGWCNSCGEQIRLADGCPSCRPLPLACSSCGTVQDAGAPPLVGSVCVERRAEAPFGRDEDGAE